MRGVTVVLLFLPTFSDGVRYHLCDFTCPQMNTSWRACRSERCTPRLAEDGCADGAEASLSTEGGAREGQGRALSGPQDCEAWGVSAPGSFSERCEICLKLSSEVVKQAHEQSIGEGAVTSCNRAVAAVQELLPTFRSCKLSPPLCTSLVNELSNTTCHAAWEQLRRGKSAAEIQEAQMSACGAMLSQRAGSGVPDVEVCPAPRDIGARVMALSAVIALGIFALQLTQT